MKMIDRLDDKLYVAKYITHDSHAALATWMLVKSNTLYLDEAVQVVKDKFGEHDTFRAPAICEQIILNHDAVDEKYYKRVIDVVFSNSDVARTVLDGASNGGYSFLLEALWNKGLKLSPEQKAFAYDEAMNKIGTSRYYDSKSRRSMELDEKQVSDDTTVYVESGNSKNPIGERTATEYFDYVGLSLSTTQAHGIGAYDIRYCILRNPNWSSTEKEKLIKEFYPSDLDYDQKLDDWEWGIVNDSANLKGHSISQFNRDLLYECSFEELVAFYRDIETASRIWSEIEFCRTMHKVRPQTWEVIRDAIK